MSRCIDADALMPKLKFIQEAEHQIYGKESWGFASKCITAVEDAPTIDERKKGKWLREDGEHVEPDAICSACGFDWMWSDRGYFKFCPNCGARMDGGQDE